MKFLLGTLTQRGSHCFGSSVGLFQYPLRACERAIAPVAASLPISRASTSARPPEQTLRVSTLAALQNATLHAQSRSAYCGSACLQRLIFAELAITPNPKKCVRLDIIMLCTPSSGLAGTLPQCIHGRRCSCKGETRQGWSSTGMPLLITRVEERTANRQCMAAMLCVCCLGSLARSHFMRVLPGVRDLHRGRGLYSSSL
jgi:hypothetical protein